MPSNISKARQLRFWLLWRKSGAIIPNTNNFYFDPFIGCPFDTSELTLVDEVDGYKRKQSVILNKLGTDIPGTLYAIGVNAKYLDGNKFTAVIIKVDTQYHLATIAEIKPLQKIA